MRPVYDEGCPLSLARAPPRHGGPGAFPTQRRVRHDGGVAPPAVRPPGRVRALRTRRPVTVAGWGERFVGPPTARTFAVAHALAAMAEAMATVSRAGSLFFNVSPDASRSQV